MNTGIGFWGYSAAGVAFLSIAAWIAVTHLNQRRGAMLLLACLATSFWASNTALSIATGRHFLVSPTSMDIVQTLGWLLFLSSIVWSKSEFRSSVWPLCIVLAVVVLVFGLLLGEELRIVGPYIALFSRILLNIFGLVLLENIFRNTPRSERWRIKFLIISVAGMFVFDVFYYTNFVMLNETDFGHFEARGWAYSLVAPLVGIAAHRSRFWSSPLGVSRRVAFYSSTILISGGYIVAMSASASLIRHFGGTWGGAAQMAFLFSALLFLLVLLSSGAFRAHVKVFIDKNFFALRYDYRDEWLRFTNAISDIKSQNTLEERILHAVASTFDSPAAAVWLRSNSAYAVVASLNMAAASFSRAEGLPIERYMRPREWVLLLGRSKDAAGNVIELNVPDTIQNARDPWVLIPLMHMSDVLGFILLAEPRAPRILAWEDFDLMRIIGRQAGGYLAEQQASAALAEAKQFEKFNQRSAFVLHDIKNLVSQLSLLTVNLERHGAKPEFRQDMATTIENAVEKMRQMIQRISDDDVDRSKLNFTEHRLVSLLYEVAGPRADTSYLDGMAHVLVRGDGDRLRSLFGHLIDNAVEAAGESGWVKLNIFSNRHRSVVEVSDNGPGMDEAFVRNCLFTPFQSTKHGGFGIGVYQCRVYARELGGDLEVVSSPGAGTTVRVTLPAVSNNTSEGLLVESTVN